MGNEVKDIIYSGAVSFSWILNSSYIASKNNAFKEVLNEYEKEYNGKINNGATILAFAYIALVFPKESDLLENITDIDYQIFEVIRDDRNSCENIHDFLKRLRNSISHAKIEIDDKGCFTFKDGRNTINFIVKIDSSDFGDFLIKLLIELENKLT